VDEPPKLKRDYLGDLTDELEEFGSGSYIEQFVSGGPKNYAFSVLAPHKKAYDQMQSKGHNLELWEFKGCKLYFFEEHDPGRRHTVACTQS